MILLLVYINIHFDRYEEIVETCVLNLPISFIRKRTYILLDYEKRMFFFQ